MSKTPLNTDTALDEILDLAGFQIFPNGANESRLKAKAKLQELLIQSQIDEVDNAITMALGAEPVSRWGKNRQAGFREGATYVVQVLRPIRANLQSQLKSKEDGAV